MCFAIIMELITLFRMMHLQDQHYICEKWTTISDFADHHVPRSAEWGGGVIDNRSHCA